MERREAVRWEFWIDRGGTFTDCLGRDPNSGRIHVAKLLSSDRAPLAAIRSILGVPEPQAIPACDIRMGTTVATNALLERKGERALLVITRGFGDLLEIGTQARPGLFELKISKPKTLYEAVLEVDARCDASGRVLERPNLADVRRSLESFHEAGIKSAAIVVLHAYANSDLERELGELAEKVGFEHVALSHQIAAELGMLARGDTTMLDAYLTPLIGGYVRGLLSELEGSSLRLMQSSGALVDAARFRGPNAILSGPAAGVVAGARVSARAGSGRAIGFDMGGTSTDVSRWDGELERVYEADVAGVRVRAPMLAIHTVAAGGGSLCRFDGRRLSVGPESAGADPGPLCYGRPQATELTVTDCNLVLGRLQPDRFPFELDSKRPRAALDRLSHELSAGGHAYSAHEVAEGFVRVANGNMAEAIRRVSVARGHDVRDHALVVFGGAGGQHACALARLLGIRTLLFHPLAGVLSALGMGVADVGWHGAADGGRRLLDEAALDALKPLVARLSADGREALAREGFEPGAVELRARVDLRYRGTETSLTLPLSNEVLGASSELSSASELYGMFEAAHAQRFGYARPTHEVEVVELRVEAIGRHPHVDAVFAGLATVESSPAGQRPQAARRSNPARRTELFIGGTLRRDVPVFHREALVQAETLTGPLLVLEPTSTLLLEPGFSLELAADGMLIARDLAGVSAPDSEQQSDLHLSISPARTRAPDPVLLEIMANLFMSIAEQMGQVLRRTALSTNIRERLDFSCAIFDQAAGLVANAPHIPVHLGAMSESVREIVEAHKGMQPGDVFVTNDPAAGGSHLPDITVVTPVHDDAGTIRFFAASRGHHADIGGITPGSMPPFSQSLCEEGVVLRGLRVVHAGRFEREALLAVLTGAKFPAREPPREPRRHRSSDCRESAGCAAAPRARRSIRSRNGEPLHAVRARRRRRQSRRGNRTPTRRRASLQRRSRRRHADQRDTRRAWRSDGRRFYRHGG